LGGDRITAYVDADIFALTSRFFEETSLAALEAAACGKATIVAAQCEIPGLASAHGGRVTDLAVGAIATSLRELLEDNAAREEMGRRARQFVRTNLTAQRAAELHENLFEELLAAAPKARSSDRYRG
jgi:glycosyltransferase involved in cell wall biosynthesis